ncbi:MAG: DNA-3-methyladenine glycosylase 2 family protein [Chitinophagaceae bacterium]
MLPIYISHLVKDKKLLTIVGDQEPVQLVKRSQVYLHLCSSIMSQQLSTKVAEVIYKRFLHLYEGGAPTAEQIVQTPFATLRAIGLSTAKTNYIQHVARFDIEQGMNHEKLEKMTDEEIIEYLTQIKGVGRWTVEMLLMFTLAREDVFAIDDLGIQNAMIHLYGLDRADKKKFREHLLRISKRWKPYRTYACIHLWRWKDNRPVSERVKTKKFKKEV